MDPYDKGYMPAWSRAQHFRRAESFVTVTSAGVQLLGANPNRMGLIISCPVSNLGVNATNSQMAAGVDTSTTGVKMTATTTNQGYAILNSATMLETTGAGVVADLEIVRSAVTTKLFRATTSGQFAGAFPLSANDVIRWNVITAIGASITDFSLGLFQTNTLNRVTISVNNPALDTKGMTLYPANNPWVLWRDVIGDALTEDLFAVTQGSNLTVGIWDIFY